MEHKKATLSEMLVFFLKEKKTKKKKVKIYASHAHIKQASKGG